jgi:hypothetical protein
MPDTVWLIRRNDTCADTSNSGSPCRAHAATSDVGTASYTGVTPNPSAAASASTSLAT